MTGLASIAMPPLAKSGAVFFDNPNFYKYE
jgi:hypothetical protein